MPLGKAPGAQFEISIDGKPRSYDDRKAVAIEVAEYLKWKYPLQPTALMQHRLAELALNPQACACEPLLASFAKRLRVVPRQSCDLSLAKSTLDSLALDVSQNLLLDRLQRAIMAQ